MRQESYSHRSDRTIHRLSDRGVIWRVESERTGPQLRVRCTAVSVEEAALWRALAAERAEGLWSLTAAREEDGQFTLTTPLFAGVPLASWLSSGRSTEAESLLLQVQDLVRSLPETLFPNQQFPTRESLVPAVLIADNKPLLAALPWFQLGKERQADPAECSTLQRDPAPAAERMPQSVMNRADYPSRGAVAAVADMAELPATAEIPRLRLASPRRIPLLLVSIMALSMVLGFVWWRYEAASARTAACPAVSQVGPALVSIMQSRARSIMELDEQALYRIEQDPLLSRDIALIRELKEREWQVIGLSFPVSRVETASCDGDVVEVYGTVGQDAFEQCQSGTCRTVPARRNEPMILRLTPDLSQIVAADRDEDREYESQDPGR